MHRRRRFPERDARPGYGGTHGNVHGAVNRATDSDAFEYAARAGFAASGVLHLLVGYIILQIALGSADQSGALAALAGQTGSRYGRL